MRSGFGRGKEKVRTTDSPVDLLVLVGSYAWSAPIYKTTQEDVSEYCIFIAYPGVAAPSVDQERVLSRGITDTNRGGVRDAWSTIKVRRSCHMLLDRRHALASVASTSLDPVPAAKLAPAVC